MDRAAFRALVSVGRYPHTEEETSGEDEPIGTSRLRGLALPPAATSGQQAEPKRPRVEEPFEPSAAQLRRFWTPWLDSQTTVEAYLAAYQASGRLHGGYPAWWTTTRFEGDLVIEDLNDEDLNERVLPEYSPVPRTPSTGAGATQAIDAKGARLARKKRTPTPHMP